MKKRWWFVISPIIICLVLGLASVMPVFASRYLDRSLNTQPQIGLSGTYCSKCGKQLTGADGEQSQLAVALGLTLCMDCWLDSFYGSDRSDPLTSIATLNENSKLPLATLDNTSGNSSTYLRGDLTWATPPSGGSPEWGSITGTLSNQADLQNALNGKLSAITGVELDNVFSSNGLLKKTGIATYTIDASIYLTGNQNITLSGDLSGSGTTSISGNVTGIRGKSITLSTGFLKYSGSAWTFDNSAYLTGNQNITLTGAVTGSGTTSIATTLTSAGLDNVFSSNGLLKRTGVATYTVDSNAYITGNQNITLSGDASGSGTTAITVTNTGLKGVALPTLSTGYLYYNGSAWAFQTPAGGSNPAWYGKLYAASGDCNPIIQTRHENMLAVSGPTPTGIGITTGRCVQFTPPANITVTNIRVFGVGATTSLYKFAIYPVGTGSAKTWDSGTVTTAANTWLNLTTGLPITLTAGTKYWWCVTVVATGTTAGFRSEAAPLGTNYWGANVAPLGGTSLGLPIYAQFTVTSPGVFPATLPVVAAAAYSGGTTGTVPFSYLDYGGAK